MQRDGNAGTTNNLMILKRTILLFAFIFSGFLGFSQNIQYYVNAVASNSDVYIESVELVVNGTRFQIDLDGQLNFNNRRSNVTYYGQFDSEYKQGKVKSVNGVTLDYYDQFSSTDYSGKLRSIGGNTISYYDSFTIFVKKGLVKTIGNINIEYYDRFSGEDKDGKVKSVGSVNVAYFDRFDGDERKGKMRSAGNTQITYFDRFDRNHAPGIIRSITGTTPRLRIYDMYDDVLIN